MDYRGRAARQGARSALGCVSADGTEESQLPDRPIIDRRSDSLARGGYLVRAYSLIIASTSPVEFIDETEFEKKKKENMKKRTEHFFKANDHSETIG